MKPLHEKLREARASRGWTTNRAAKKMGVGHNVLAALEHLNPRRQPDPWDVSLVTVLRIIHVYWPEIELADFLLNCTAANVGFCAFPLRAVRKLSRTADGETLFIERKSPLPAE